MIRLTLLEYSHSEAGKRVHKPGRSVLVAPSAIVFVTPRTDGMGCCVVYGNGEDENINVTHSLDEIEAMLVIRPQDRELVVFACRVARDLIRKAYTLDKNPMGVMDLLGAIIGPETGGAA